MEGRNRERAGVSWDRFFQILQRISSVLVILLVTVLLAIAARQWFATREFAGVIEPYEREFGGKFERTLPYSGQEIETAEGSLIAIFQDNGNVGERVELGGITITNPNTGESVEVAGGDMTSVVQFELIFDQGNDGKVVGYLATIATPDQYDQGRQDLIVGALPALTRNIVARGIRYSDLPRIRGDGSVGLLMWPEEDEAYLVAVRLADGAIIERSKVNLPALKDNQLSQGRGASHFELGRQGVPFQAPRSAFQEW
jgi:hypothetical protein